MTALSRSPRPAAAQVAMAVNTLRTRGLRVSAARRLLLEALFRADGPVTAEEVASGLGGRLPACDLASVYRNLDTLERHGVVTHVHLGHGPGLYAPAGSAPREYALCDACGALTPLPPAAAAAVRRAVRAALDFEPSFTHFPLSGRCSECATDGSDDAHS